MSASTVPAGLVDVHTHVVPETLPDYVGRHLDVAWPSMAPASQPCHSHVMVSGAIYRTVTHQCWDCQVRAADMAARGVDLQVLSVMPELLSYWLEPEDGAALCRHLNEVIADMVRRHPGHFTGLAAVPLQDLDLAVRELDFAIHQLGLRGVEIGTNVNGKPIGHPDLAPFFEAAADWDAAVFVHPLRPAGMDRLVGPATLEQITAFPGETGLAAISMITGGTFARLPRLRIAFSHGGGTLALLLPRLQHAWQTMAPVRDRIELDPAQAARRMYYDDLVYDGPTLRWLIDVFGDTQVMAGTDYPFTIMDPDPAGRLDALGLEPAALQRLRGGNARRWLALTD